MGLFTKFGSFVDRVLGEKPKKPSSGAAKLAKRHGSTSTESSGQLREVGIQTTEDHLNRSMQEAIAKTRREIEEQQRKTFGNTKPPTKSVSLWEIAKQEEAEAARADWEQRQRYVEEESKRDMTPELKYLHGELVHVVSTNVDFIQYDRERQILYVGYKNGGWYCYYDIDVNEALGMFHATSHGKWVWDHLRLRGSVFGFQKHYAFLEYNLAGGYQPKYMDDSGWQAEHAAIAPNGETPMSWRSGSGPYPAWYGVPSEESKKHQVPMATIFESSKAKKTA